MNEKPRWPPVAANAAEAAIELLARLPRGNVVVRLGMSGCLVAQRGSGVVHVPGVPVAVVDTTGAGDAHFGAYIAGLAAGCGAEAAARARQRRCGLNRHPSRSGDLTDRRGDRPVPRRLLITDLSARVVALRPSPLTVASSPVLMCSTSSSGWRGAGWKVSPV